MPRPVVAAICYRRKNNGLEFLLVRTKGGKYWTFPKGHVETDLSEKPWDAAKREAREEAGALGAIDRRALTSYAYPKSDEGEEYVVTAYMMSVDSRMKGHEPDRHPRWFSLARAIEKLASGRKRKYAREHERVVREAAARLQQ